VITPKALFEPADVEARIVYLSSVVPDARDCFRRLQTLGYRRRKLMEQEGLDHLECNRLVWLNEEVDRLSARVEECVGEVEAMGGELVDIERGEVTFATFLGGEPAFYVWTPGDPVVLWYRLATEPVGEAHLISE